MPLQCGEAAAIMEDQVEESFELIVISEDQAANVSRVQRVRNRAGAGDMHKAEMMTLSLDHVRRDPGAGHGVIVKRFPQDGGHDLSPQPADFHAVDE